MWLGRLGRLHLDERLDLETVAAEERDTIAVRQTELDRVRPLDPMHAEVGAEQPLLHGLVLCRGEQLGKPEDEDDARRMLETLSGWEHEVVSGLCLRRGGWEELHSETTLVRFRPLDDNDVAHYLASGEWKGRAGAYAIQGLGASLVERVEGDYLNVVGLPGALLVRLLAEHFPGVYGFG